MKNFLLTGIITLILVLPSPALQSDADVEVARTQDYINATMQSTAQARINALNAYIKKFPDTTKRWTILAHYQLSLNYLQEKNYSKAAELGKKALNIGLGEGEIARQNLILAECYGVKASSLYDKSKALQYANKAISLAGGDNVVKTAADKIKKGLTAPPPPKETPEQKMNRLVHQDEDLSSAISFYRSLGSADKGNTNIHQAYALALFKANQLDSALKEFTALYNASKEGIYAYRIGSIYELKARRNRSLYQNAARNFVAAHILYLKENKSSNSRSAKQYAKNMIVNKYNLQARIDAYNRKQSQRASSSQRNETKILETKRKIRKLERTIRREYSDIAPPDYITDELDKLNRQLRALESGGSVIDDSEGKALQEEIKKVDKELANLISEVKKELD